MTTVFLKSKIDIGLFGMVFPMGACWEKSGQLGCHHLMEHLLCKNFEHLYEKLTSLAVDWNAYTSSDRVVIYFSGLNSSLQEVVPELYQAIVGQPKWTEEQFNTEKLVVIQEYEDTFNSQESGLLNNLLRKHYNYYTAIGNKPDVVNFSYADSLELAKIFSRPQLLCMLGKKFIKGNLPTFEEKYPTSKPVYSNSHNVLIEDVPKQDKTVVGLISTQPVPEKDINKLGFVVACLNDGLESPLYQEIREKRGLAYSSAGFKVEINNWSIPVFCATTSNENVRKLRKVYKEFFSNKPSRHISKSRFDAMYNYTVIAQKKLEALPHNKAMHDVLNKSSFEGIESITYAEAKELADKYLSFETFKPFSY